MMRVTCRARSFKHLTPQLLQTVASVADFKFGIRYLYGSRVRILESRADRIHSAVTEGQDTYRQTLILNNGTLEAQCTCPDNGQALCRHSIAGLLKHYRWSHQLHSTTLTGRLSMEDHVPSQSANVPDVSLRDITVYMQWMQQTATALDLGQPLPEPPALQSEEARGWVQAIQRLDEQTRRSGEKQAALVQNLHAQESKLDEVLSHVYLNMASLYETLGQLDKAVAVRGRAGVLEPR